MDTTSRISRRSRSSGPPSKQWTPQRVSDKNNAETYLPGTRGIYITKTKSGRPALGRKKPDGLLQEGFDLLGQAFGLPSRMDIEQQACRPQSSSSSYSGRTVSPPASHQTPTPRGRLSKPSYILEGEDSPEAVSESIFPSPPASTPTRLPCRKNIPRDPSGQDRLAEESDPSMMPGQFKPPTQPMPMSTPPPQPMWNTQPLGNMSPMWNTQPLGNNMSPMWNTQPIGNNMSSVWNAQPLGHSVPPMSPNRVIPTSPSTNPQLYAVQLTGPCSPTHAQHPVFLAPRSVSMPLPLSQHQFTAPYPELKSPTSPLFTPVAGPISPLLLSPVSIEGMTPQGNGGGIAAMNSPLRFSPDEAKKCEEHYSESVKKQIKEATRGMVDKACQHMGKRIRHVHICAGCGKKRPEEYQKAHPLKRGQIPERNYCDSCLHDASATERSDTDDTSEANHAEEAPGNTPNGTQKGSKNYFDRKLTNKSKRFGLLSNILPRPVTSEDHPEQSDSPSSANESEIKVSATTRVAGRKVKQRRRRHPPPSGEEDARINEGNVPSPELGEPVHHQGIHSRDGKQPTPKDELHTEQSSPMAHSKRGVLEEIISGTQPYHSAGKTQGKDTGSASEAAATQKRSGLPRLFSSKAAPKTKPDICAKTVPGTLGAAVLVDEAGNNQPEAVNRANKYPGPRNEVQSAADAYDAYDSSFSAEQPAGDARHTRHEYKYTQERKLRDRGHSQLRTRPHENSRSEQPVRDTQASQRGCSGCRRVQRPRADERAQGTQEEHRGAVRSNESATPYNVRHNTDDGRGGSREETDKVEENTQSLDESNLAASAEFFNDFTGAGGGSDTTPFSIPSFVTGTQPSEVSHNSHQRLDENVAIAYEQAEALITDQVANQPHCPVELPESSYEVGGGQPECSDRNVREVYYPGNTVTESNYDSCTNSTADWSTIVNTGHSIHSMDSIDHSRRRASRSSRLL